MVDASPGRLSHLVALLQAKKHPEGVRWQSMEHKGVIFPEPYVPHGVKMR